MSSSNCMLAKEWDPKKVKGWPVWVEPKLDGVRVICVVTRTHAALPVIIFYSRASKLFLSFDHMKPQILSIARQISTTNMVVFDGEVVSGEFNKTSGEVRRKEVPCLDAVYHIFDIPSISGTLRERRLQLNLLSLHNAPSVRRTTIISAGTAQEVDQIYKGFLLSGHEGAVVKDPNSEYEYKRSFAWMKLKESKSIDAPITSVFEGRGKYGGKLGGITVNHKGKKVNVGTGFTDEQRQSFWDHAKDLIGQTAEVGYQNETPDGSLRHPRFLRLRGDK